MTPVELRQMIRFALGQLSASNGHHEFESLCRELAAAAFCERVIPATGPVSGLGDQGRDFETFRSFLSEVRPEEAFLGYGSDSVIVFACTLQAERVEEKIWSDVDSIVSHEHLPADAIVAMTEADVLIGRRNRLRARAQEEHSIDLQIIDGTAIADLLGRPDASWIASRYLDIPEMLLPKARPDPDDTQYLERKAKWAARGLPHATWGDFEDLRTGLRYVYLQSRFGEDLHWWLDLLAPLAKQDDDVRLKRAAVYERAVALMRSAEDLSDVLDDLQWYFNSIADVLPSEELEDARALLGFCLGASSMFDLGLDQADVAEWEQLLIEHIDAEIEKTSNPARLFSLHISRGALEIPRLDAKLDFEPVHQHWRIALGCAESASLRSITELADLLTPIAPAFASDRLYRQFVQEVERVLAEQQGDAAVAQRSQDRGLACAEAGQMTDALREFHSAKDSWIAAHETGALLSTLGQIGICYRHLGLLHASAYYFLTLVSLAINSGRQDSAHVARGLLETAMCEYRLGNWRRFLCFARLGLRAHAHLDVDAGDFDEYKVLSRVMHASGLVLLVANHHASELAEEAREIAEQLLPDELLADFDAEPPEWCADAAKVAQLFAEQESLQPLKDLSSEYTCCWEAHGVTWSLTSSTTDAFLSDRIAAAMQVFQADTAEADLCLPRLEVSSSVTKGNEASTEIASSTDYFYELHVQQISIEADHEELRLRSQETVAAVITITGMTSLLQRSDFMELFEERMQDGLASKITVHRLYDQLLDEWLSSCSGIKGAPLGETVCRPEHDELRWPDHVGPNYSEERAREAVLRRYENFLRATKATRLRLSASAEFLSTVENLRAAGWLDWHVLGAIHGVCTTYRAYLRGPVRSPEELRGRITDPFAEEGPDAPLVPASEFTQEALEASHLAGTASALTTAWDHALNHPRIPADAVADFLRVRYRHYDDDAPHDAIL